MFMSRVIPRLKIQLCFVSFQLFAASFPLAPLIALLINMVDIKIDAKRLIWMYKRPVGRIAQDIGSYFSSPNIVKLTTEDS